MSDEFYPLGGPSNVKVKLFDGTVADDMEGGKTTTNSTWPEHHFKRLFTVTHQNLSVDQMEYLTAFASARSGRADSFWFRDNVHRSGNTKVRFAEEFEPELGGSRVYSPTVKLLEVEPIRLLPRVPDVVSASGSVVPTMLLDPNRQVTIFDQNTLLDSDIVRDDARYSAAMPRYNLSAQTVNNSPVDILAQQYTPFKFSAGSPWSRSDVTIPYSGSLFGATIFMFVKFPSNLVSRRVLFSVGTTAAASAVGLAIASDNFFEPFMGGAEVFTNCRYENNAVSTWRSIAVTFAFGANDIKLYVNGALIGTDSIARNIVTGYAALGASPSGTLRISDTTSRIGQVLFRHDVAYSLANIQGLHNLFAYQYGLPLV